MSRKITTEIFVKECREIYNNYYSYEKTVFTGVSNKIIVTCPIHGDFSVQAIEHHRKRGCLSCIKEAERVKSSKDFLDKSKIVHKNFYDYSKVIYVKSNAKVRIVCPIHGEFQQSPNNHLNGQGCPTCGKLKNKSPTFSKTFLQRANKLHQGNLDFSQVVYITAKTRIMVLCKKHGEFETTPDSILAGHGCPKCNLSKGELLISDFLKKYNIAYSTQYRIPTCRDKNPLPFDFAIFEDQEKTKLKCLIEYDGIQHFKVCTKFKMTEETLKDNQRRDKIKTDYCLENSIKLFRFSYLEKDTICDCLKLNLTIDNRGLNE